MRDSKKPMTLTLVQQVELKGCKFGRHQIILTIDVIFGNSNFLKSLSYRIDEWYIYLHSPSKWTIHVCIAEYTIQGIEKDKPSTFWSPFPLHFTTCTTKLQRFDGRQERRRTAELLAEVGGIWCRFTLDMLLMVQKSCDSPVEGRVVYPIIYRSFYLPFL